MSFVDSFVKSIQWLILSRCECKIFAHSHNSEFPMEYFDYKIRNFNNKISCKGNKAWKPSVCGMHIYMHIGKSLIL